VPRARTRLVLTLAGTAALVVALAFLARPSPSEVPTIEQVLAPADVAEIDRLRHRFGREADVVLVGLRRAGGLPAARVARVEKALAAVEGVARTWVLPARDPAARVLLLTLEPGTVRLSRARELSAAIDRTLDALAEPDETVHVVGTPQLRAASWSVATTDLRLMLPLLVLAVVAVPVLFFAAAGAIVFPLVMAALTTAACLAAYRLVEGPLDALALLLVPMIWSVATLDAIHLYARARTASVAAARARLFVPCLLTTLTTAGGFLALAVQGDSHLIRVFGIWAATGTALAYALTFTLGGALLALAPPRPRPPRWPARLALRIVRASARRPRSVAAAWLVVLALAAVGASRLHVAVRFPHVFAASEPVAGELRAMQELTGTDLAPLDIYVEPTDEDGRRPVPFASALLTVSHYAGALPEARHVLPRDLLGDRPFEPGRGPLAEQLTKIAADPRLAPWIRFEQGAGRIQVHLAPMSFERRREIATWLHRFDETMLSHHRLSLAGPGHLYLVAEERGLRGALVGGILSLLVVAGALAWSFRRPATFVAALAGNLAPLLLVAGLMGALGIPWSLAVIPLPAVLLGLAVDDTVHLLWPARSEGRGATRGARRAGPALLATTAVLAACIATMMLSGLQVNREIGLLLPAGLVLALACDLSLVPALLRANPERSARSPRG
jgi:hypothetical protein